MCLAFSTVYSSKKGNAATRRANQLWHVLLAELITCIASCIRHLLWLSALLSHVALLLQPWSSRRLSADPSTSTAWHVPTRRYQHKYFANAQYCCHSDAAVFRYSCTPDSSVIAALGTDEPHCPPVVQFTCPNLASYTCKYVSRWATCCPSDPCKVYCQAHPMQCSYCCQQLLLAFDKCLFAALVMGAESQQNGSRAMGHAPLCGQLSIGRWLRFLPVMPQWPQTPPSNTIP